MNLVWFEKLHIPSSWDWTEDTKLTLLEIGDIYNWVQSQKSKLQVWRSHDGLV